MDDIHQKPTIRTGNSLTNDFKLRNSDPVYQLQVANKYCEQHPLLQKYLELSELVQWAGKPNPTVLAKFLAAVTAIIAFLAVSFWYSSAGEITPLKYVFEALFGLTYLAYLVWHFGALTTTYCVTDKRIMWIKPGTAQTNIDSLSYEKIRQLSSGMGTVSMLAGPTQYHQRFLCGLGSEAASVEKIIAANMRNTGEVEAQSVGLRQVTSTKSFAQTQKRYLRVVCVLITLQLVVAFCQFMNRTTPHYEMFVPGSLKADEKYPLIIGFDAVGHGQSEVDALRAAAEKDKAFVIGVNDTGVGTTYETWGGRVDQSLNEVLAKYPIDSKRIYISGFAAGGMAAYWYAEHRGGRVRGVIINTALMPYEGESPFDDKLPAAYPKDLPAVMLASPTDKRYASMKKARSILEKRAGWQVKWIEFPGGQIYAPSKDYEQAVDWLFKQE
jgi:hypothetical protein